MIESSIDQNELDKFNKTEEQWWDLNGEFKSLHEIHPVRMEYVFLVIKQHFKSAKNLQVIDVGSGGGLVAEAMKKAGHKVTGLDANSHNVRAATEHAKRSGLKIDYKNITVEEHIKSGKKYDVVLCLEVIEHVANPEIFVRNVSCLLEKGGVLIFSTINRTKKAYLLAILMAEYILRWVPQQTHDYSKFIKPSEFVRMLEGTGLKLEELKGLSYSPIGGEWHLSDDIDVNYFAVIKFGGC
jgi:2-polyprenyl-6-hydroxyphenyl methylase/3-demethylubiquinone-9 3-methyltransferase